MKMVTHKMIKKHKQSVKVMSDSKKQNAKLKSKLKSDKLNNKKLRQGRNTNIKNVQVNVENGKVENMKSDNKQLRKDVQEETNLIKKSVAKKYQKENINKVGNVQNADVKIDANSKKLKREKSTESDKVVKYALRKKLSTRNNVSDVQSNIKFNPHINTTSKIVKSQKRKRVDSTSKKEKSDCLNLNDLSKEHILQCISVIFHLTEEQLKNKNALFDDESQPVFMQVTCIRVPKTPRRCMRIPLPYTIVSPNDEVALFVGDLQRGRRKDYEPTVEHYEDLLRKHGCTRIKSIIPMNQVKTEYDQYELKRKLVDSYDYFLVDGKIAGHLSHLLGKEFYKKRKLPTSIRMQSKDLKHEVEYALRKSIMQIHSSGDTHIIQVGHTSMRKEEIVENILKIKTWFMCQ
ncbi:unnamed protein product [Xylocopa violacea]|uniref:Uncharacterized protein n=1 Tax=Xylocopa violacea TaxID=135666 RepID=A0ABP1N7U5_XYLVO